MAEDKNPESSGLTIALPVTVILALLAGWFLNHSLPYQDERPASRPLQTRYAAAQDVDARLWQDPFAAVDNAGKEMQEISVDGKTLRLETESSRHTPQQVYYGIPFTSKDKIIIFAITLSGGPYQEDAEERMRWRYAVLSALANQNATPYDEQHIGYFQPDQKSGMVLPKKVAFEWWSLPDHKPKVLLLWVDESSLYGQPAVKLQELLRQASHPKNQPVGIMFDYAVLGPNSSTLLREMLKEKDYGNKQKIDYYSATATASDVRLLQDINITGCNTTVSDCFGNRGITLYRTTATDEAMMNVLVQELNVRQVKAYYYDFNIIYWLLKKLDINQNEYAQKLLKKLGIHQDERKDHVVILSEWDTFYGRAMPEAFNTAWERTIPVAFKTAWNRNKTVRVYSYMRGLDGKLPNKDDKANNATEKKSDSQDKSGTDTQIEFPEGQDQKDYLRRLTNKIFDLDQRLKDEGNEKGVAAIGVLGSDVHDELMIMEALRQLFPHKLFFTTDLDAAYSHPAKWPQTHNLLVASAFDLTLRDELQGEIPPFRDSYQTAFFLTTQLALKEKATGEKEIVNQIGIPPPRLFEIGRSRPVPLPTCTDKVLPSQRDDNTKPKCSWNKEEWPACANTVQPEVFATSRLHWTVRGIMVVGTIPILLLFVSWWVRKRVRQFMIGVAGGMLPAICLRWIFAAPPPQLHWIWGAGMVAILFSFVSHWILEKVLQFKLPFYFGLGVGGLLFLTYCYMPSWNDYITQPNAEPFYWHEGVSVWPSQLLRLSAFLFAAGFFFWGHKRIQEMQCELQERSPSSNKHKQIFALPESSCKNNTYNVFFIGSWEEDKKVKTVSPDHLWEKYLRYSCFLGSIGRVVLHGLVFFLAALLLMSWSGLPNAPVRGMTAFYWNRKILFVAVLVTIMLTMWVIENARLCERLIYHLSSKPSKWNLRAKVWAIDENKIAPECVEDWLDIQLVTRLTATMQPLIWGPVVCITLMILARSPVFDDWDIPWGLMIVFIAMLLYAISAEVYLWHGAQYARVKALNQLTKKIREQLNLEHPDETIIKRIEAEIDRIEALRDGAFRPWYEWPLLHSFGGLGTLGFLLQHLAEAWRIGAL